MTSGRDSFANRVAQTTSFIVMPKKPAKSADHLVSRAKIYDGIAIVPEDLAMLVAVFGQHARPHRSQFESSHGAAVTVGASHQAEGDFRPPNYFPDGPSVSVSAGHGFGFAILAPITSIKGDIEAMVNE